MSEEEFRNNSDYNYHRYTEWMSRGTNESNLYKSVDWDFSKGNKMDSAAKGALATGVILSPVIALAIAVGVAVAPVAVPAYLIYKGVKESKEEQRKESEK